MLIAGGYYRFLDKYIPGEELIEYKEDEDYDILEDYWIYKPYVRVEIAEFIPLKELRYRIYEPTLVDEEIDFLSEIYKNLDEILILKELRIDIEEKEKILVDAFEAIVSELPYEPDEILRAKFLYYLYRDFLGFGPIDPIMNDRYVEDISCDGYGIPIFVFHKKYGNVQTELVFDEEELDRFVQTLVQMSGKHVSHGNPILDATLPDGSRLQVTYGRSVTPRGSSFTIRKFTETPLTPLDLIDFGTFNAEQMAYFWLCVENKLNFMAVGETAAGKTTTLNAILMFLPPNAKVISIEDTREIALKHENWIATVTRHSTTSDEREITMYDLLKAALRQRPDYIVVGEVRGVEAQTLFQAMSTGHAAYATLHAGDIHQAIYRLENEPLNVPRSMIQFLDVVSIQTQWTERGIRRRRVKNIYEILGIDPNDKNLLINEIYRWDVYSDSFYQVNALKKLEKIAVFRGEDVEETLEELKRRASFLEHLRKMGIADYKVLTNMIHSYYRNPEESFEFIVKEAEEYESIKA